MSADRYERAVAAIDEANAPDPNTIEVGGERRPKEQAHAEMAVAWVQQLDPNAGEAQLLAARAHHLRRWAVARDEYPAGRAGYLRWRAAQKARHAEEVGTILRSVGYPQPFIDRVQKIVRKEGLARDPAVQVHEDALCLVFLETQLDSVVDDLGEERALEVVRKTAKKMSATALEATATLPLDERGRALLDAALGR